VLWVLDCVPDICSDLSAFHRIDDASELEGPVFFALAQRLPFYDGAVRAHVARQVQRAQAAGAPVQPAAAAQPERLPPATGESLEALNGRHGRKWFAYTQVPRIRPEGGD
jgi:hypothetical protein